MKKLIVANWKMNPSSFKEAKKIFDGIRKTAVRLKKVQTVVCPPFVYLQELGGSTSKRRLSLQVGVQDLFWEERGAYTGEISADMAKEFGAKYAIIGHSERREHLSETDEMINKKIKTALRNNLRVIFCVGENARDDRGDYLKFIKSEVERGLKGIPRNFLKNLAIAYEPIWAIGKRAKGADSPESVFQMSIYIRRILMQVAGREASAKVPILYGGSVGAKNAESFLKDGGVQGLLVGGKSLLPKEFGEILKIAEKI